MPFKYTKLIAVIPLFLWLAWWTWLQYTQTVSDKYVFEANTMEWNLNGKRLQAIVHDTVANEVQTYSVQIRDASESTLYSTTYDIDWDLGNRGFFRAMNVDNDPELELVLYQHAGANSVYLDLSSDQIVEHPFKNATARAQELAIDWLNAHSPDVFTAGLWMLATAGYYLILFVFLAGTRLYRISRKNTRQAV